MLTMRIIPYLFERAYVRVHMHLFAAMRVLQYLFGNSCDSLSTHVGEWCQFSCQRYVGVT
jgi:hypothetical protein